MSVLVVTGTGTGVGKTVVVAALAAVAAGSGRSVAVVKAAQTGVGVGEAGDVGEVARLVGVGVDCVELARFPEPLAPETAARRSGCVPVCPQEVVWAVEKLASRCDLVVVEGSGGFLVRFDGRGGTLADVAVSLGAPVVVVAAAGLGTLNATALTVEAVRGRGLECLGVVVGSWPAGPDLAARCNLVDLPVAGGAPLLGVVPEGVSSLVSGVFRGAAAHWLGPVLGGEWDAAGFAQRMGPPEWR